MQQSARHGDLAFRTVASPKNDNDLIFGTPRLHVTTFQHEAWDALIWFATTRITLRCRRSDTRPIGICLSFQFLDFRMDIADASGAKTFPAQAVFVLLFAFGPLTNFSSHKIKNQSSNNKVQSNKYQRQQTTPCLSPPPAFRSSLPKWWPTPTAM
jgi:hypothetical protein